MKKNNKLVSIVVPVYNVEKYLEKCINSILAQTYKNFELLLIDDGSTDNSSEICDKYSLIDNRIIVIHKPNGGLSDARNVGIDKALGEYIVFIDSDDFIKKDYIQKLYEIAILENSDLVICRYQDVYENKEISDLTQDYSKTILTKEKCYEKIFLQDKIDVSASAKFYKLSLFKDNDIKYPKGKLYEDIQIIDKIIEKSNRIIYYDYVGYYYLQRPGSIMYSNMSKDRMILVDTMKNLLDFISDKYPTIKFAAEKRYVYCNYHILGRAILNNHFKKECIILRNNILKYKKTIIFSSIYSKKEKIATLFLIIGLNPYKLMWYTYCKIKSKQIIFK